MRKEILIVIALLGLSLQSEVVHGAVVDKYNLRVSVWGDNASIGNIGAGVEILTYSYAIPSSDVSHYFWVGDNLANGGFIQFGYEIFKPNLYCLYGESTKPCESSARIANGDARWVWQYWPNSLVLDFYYGIGAENSAGPDGAWHTYEILPNAAGGWAFVFDGKTVANMNNFQSTKSKDKVYVAAEECTSSTYASGSLGPVEFRNLSYYNQNWSQVRSLTAQTGCSGEGCSGINIPYGVTVLGPNHVLAGSGQPLRKQGELIWG